MLRARDVIRVKGVISSGCRVLHRALCSGQEALNNNTRAYNTLKIFVLLHCPISRPSKSYSYCSGRVPSKSESAVGC